MPITKSALKKQRVDKKRTSVNMPIKGKVRSSVKKLGVTPSKEGLVTLYSNLDKAVRKNLLPKNRAARLKSRFSRLTKAAK